MSTNFYASMPAECEPRHLGQRAGGWEFMFRAYPDLGITDTQSWLRQLGDAEWIRDEYGRDYTIDDFLEAVEACRGGRPRDLYGNDWRDSDGNVFSGNEFS